MQSYFNCGDTPNQEFQEFDNNVLSNDLLQLQEELTPLQELNSVTQSSQKVTGCNYEAEGNISCQYYQLTHDNILTDNNQKIVKPSFVFSSSDIENIPGYIKFDSHNDIYGFKSNNATFQSYCRLTGQQIYILKFH
jgi:hypothetical protein